MSLSEMEVKGLVDNFLSKQDLRGFRYEFLKVSVDEKYQGEVSAIYNVFTPEDSLVDGPAVLIIDENSKAVRFL